MLKGDAFSCAYWPDKSVRCSTTNETFAEPCRAPKTVDTELSTCEHTMARDLKSESHMLGWAIILGSFNKLDFKNTQFLGCGSIVLIAYIIKTAKSPFSYLQTMWVNSYRKVSKS